MSRNIFESGNEHVRPAILFFPDEKSYSQISIILTMRILLVSTIKNISLRTRYPSVYREFLENKGPYNASVEVNSDKIVFDKLYLGLVGGMQRPGYLHHDNASETFCANIEKYAEHIIYADQRMYDGDWSGAIIGLTTAMEVSAYQFLDGLRGIKTNFNPSMFFMITKGTPQNIKVFIKNNGYLESSTFEKLDDLWNTRHEIVHNGNSSYRVGKKVMRPIVYEDYYIFRSALSKLLAWMGFQSLE